MVVLTEIGIKIFFAQYFLHEYKKSQHFFFKTNAVVKLITKEKNLQHHQKRDSGSQKLGLKMNSPLLLLLIYLRIYHWYYLLFPMLNY
jgi:hypothetical protein